MAEIYKPESSEMAKTWNPQEVEDKLYREWEENGYFTAHREEGKKPFTIVMPPPNITGQLHMGHALDAMLQDVPTRYHRMKGDPTLWLPGTDHASIATEVKIVDQLKAEGLTKQEIGREEFLKRAWDWKKKYADRITLQQRKLGASCDWTRQRFTMDEGCSKAVNEVFVRLYEKGLIYRGERIINWCPVCKTALSDAEVEYEEQDSHLWYIRYPAADGGEGVIVATTRPETMLGDTGVAVNPEDERYKDLIGKNLMLPIMNREIPVVADEYVEKEFGTGAVKMTPAHDPNDFEVARRHNLKLIRVIADDGKMNENAGEFKGMTREQCRKAVCERLQQMGLMVKIENYKHNVGTCYRCHTTVEPLASNQWFVKMQPLAEPAIEAVRKGETNFIPERFTKTYFNWMDNIRDWCISRQLWWGHRIPVWYCEDCGEMTVARTAPDKCSKCGGTHLHQDEDVLDTWFSSALWPFSTLGWPDNTEDLKYFYPTSMLVSGYDIIFFWVARMIFSGIEQMGEVPFKTVVMHGLVRDEQGRKMSKSLGNGIDPLEIVENYGADALRFSLALGVSPGNDMRVSEKKFDACRNFANKVWNASRFVVMNLDGKAVPMEGRRLTLADKWILSRFNEAVKVISNNLDEYDTGNAAQKIYDFAWSEFCDWYIELAKPRLLGDDEESRDTARAVLEYVLIGMLKLLHPFMPFLTDAVYRYLPGTEGTIMLKSWPEYSPEYEFAAESEQMQGIMDVINAVRNLRATMNVAPSRRAHMMLRAKEGWHDTLEEGALYFKRLAGASEVSFIGDGETVEKAASAVCPCCEVFIPLGELVDVEAELKRLAKEQKNLESEIARGEGKLSNQGFMSKAPAALVEQERNKLSTNREMLESVKARIAEMKAI